MTSITSTMLLIESLREKRAEICFPVINRGKLWYERLTNEQIAELKVWYQQWLDVTKTLIIPKEPKWLNATLNDEEEEI